MNKRIAAGVTAGLLVIGGAGAALMIPALVAAADPTSATGSSSSGSSSAQASPGTTTPGTTGDCAGMPGGPGGAGMGADDITAAAKAIGVTEADLTTALQDGKTIADVATSKGVAVQTVIDAMVAAEKAEIQADVDAGTITQTQADQQIADLTAHETAEVNGTFTPGMGGPGRHGQPPSNSSNGSSTTPSTTSTSTSS